MQRYGSKEYYFGWTERETPGTGKLPADALVSRVVERVVERLGSLLVEVAEQETAKLEGLVGNVGGAGVRSIEQARLRKYFFGKRQVSTCAFCGIRLPVTLLVAAHTKRRADCSQNELRKVSGNVLALCSLGCDALFERGLVSVSGRRIVAGPRRAATPDLKDRVTDLIGKQQLQWSTKRAPFFAVHRALHPKREKNSQK